MSHGYLLEAEYEDGWVLKEDEHDQSPYAEGRNVFHAISTSAPVYEHGKMVRYTLIGPEHTHSIDWRALWDLDELTPINQMRMERDFVEDDGGKRTWVSEGRVAEHVFGYSYVAKDGLTNYDVITV